MVDYQSDGYIAADFGDSPLSITEIPQLIAGVGCC